MSVTEKEAHWDQNRDTLKKVRGVLTADTTNRRNGTYRPLSNSHPLLSQKPRVSPAGRHTRTPPKQLPRLQTPPEHDKLKQKSNLRASKYELVPPLRPKRNAFERTAADDDSWGEDEDDEEEYADRRRRDREAYPYAGYPPTAVFSYPVFAAPNIIYPTSSLPYQTNTPHHRRSDKVKGRPRRARHRDRSDGSETGSEDERERRRNNRNRRDDDKARPHYGRRGVNREPKNPYDKERYVDEMQNTEPAVLFPYINTRPYYPPDVSEVLDRYKYSYVDSKEGRRSKLEKVAHAYIDEYPEFSSRLADEFIQDFLDDEMIPDMLIEVVSQHNQLQRDHPLYAVSAGITENFVNSVVRESLRDIVIEVIDEKVSDYFVDKLTSRDPFLDWLDGLVADVVRDEALVIGREAVLDLAGVHMEKAIAYDLIMEWVTEEIEADGTDIVREAILEGLIDDIINEEFILPEVEDACDEVAVEVLEHYNDKARRRELQEVRDHGGDKLLDGLSLDYLLSMIANQGRVLDQNAHADKFIDNMVLNILLETFFGVDSDLQLTLNDQPIQKLHEKMVTDVGLDAVLDNLCTSLDEDIADLDEYEQSIENNNSPLLGEAIQR